MYKCVCQQHSEQMYSDLIKKITNHLERVSKELQVKNWLIFFASLEFSQWLELTCIIHICMLVNLIIIKMCKYFLDE